MSLEEEDPIQESWKDTKSYPGVDFPVSVLDHLSFFEAKFGTAENEELTVFEPSEPETEDSDANAEYNEDTDNSESNTEDTDTDTDDTDTDKEDPDEQNELPDTSSEPVSDDNGDKQHATDQHDIPSSSDDSDSWWNYVTHAVDDALDDIGSELVPSISNISLLSLNQQHNTLAGQMLTDAYSTETVISSATANAQETSSRFNTSSHRHLTLQRVPNSLPLQHSQFSIGSRKSSFNSPTLQSPQMFIPQTRSSLRRSSSNSFQQPPSQSVSNQYRSQQPKQPIQIKQRAINIDDSYAEPDSPALVPISLAGSPSNFLLSHSSPPNSYKAASLLPSISQPLSRNIGSSGGPANYPLPSTVLPQTATNRLFASRPQSSQLKLSLNRFSDDHLPQPSLPLTRADSLTDSIGGRSPELAPVSSTLPPMTPLILSMPSELSSRSNSNAVVDDDCDDFNNGDSNHDNRSGSISFSSSNDKHFSTIEGTNDGATRNGYNNSDISRLSTHTQKDEQDSFSQNDDIFGETIDD
ncbi:hypothetical protein PMKS-001046 [Pichia membranifaciens]|uniref:Uncharacterized protein n=1 Tax=Pichia membranifaciens TaxID=4926 RepID=A0A1Q2YDJ7_9ASCO|nr:hypothetical protein PMKS-001046 [Pichia membranifaciens]